MIKKEVTLQVRMYTWQNRALQEAAARSGMTVADFVRGAIDYAANRNRPTLDLKARAAKEEAA